MEKIINWLKENKKELILVGIILLIGAFCRLFKIDQYMTFLGDEGRDVIIVRRLLVYGDLILIGPGTSIGNMYLGPLYYYMIAIPLFLAGFNPVGPAIMVALLGVATIFLVWLIGKEWFGSTAGLIAASLYAISPTIIIYSRSSWNPNIMPFFALLCIYSIWKVWRKNKFNWLIVLGISFAFVLQSHYLGLLLLPTLFIFWVLKIREIRNYKSEIQNFLKKSLVGLIIFAGLMSPLVIFDARHGWRNFGAIKTFFTVRQETVSIKPWKAIPNMWPVFEKATTRILTARNETAGIWTSLILFLGLVFLLIKKREPSLILTACWLGFAVLGLGLYKQEIYDHYYGFFFAAPFLITGAIADYLLKNKNYVVKFTPVAGVLILIILNLIQSPLRKTPDGQMPRSMNVAKKIEEESGNKNFNLAVIAERNYEDGYQYFLEKDNAKVVEIDAQRPETVTDQLFVVCEMPKEKCDPTHSAKAEVANFGWSKIENYWEGYGPIIYKLIHTK